MSEQVHAWFGQRPTGEVLLLLVDSGMDAITVDSPRRFGRAQSIPTGFGATS
jgi:hypothetical protein